MNDEYTAKNISIRPPEDFDFSLAPLLAEKYNKPVAFIKRGLQACREAGESENYFILRYLLKADTPENKLVTQAAIRIQEEEIP